MIIIENDSLLTQNLFDITKSDRVVIGSTKIIGLFRKNRLLNLFVRLF